MTADEELLCVSRDAVSRAMSWLEAHVGVDGRPADSDLRNGWSRLGWGLAVGGRPDLAAKVVSWVGRHRITPDGGFQSGRLTGQGYIASYPNYWLATYVISAWLAGRTDLAMRTMAYLRAQRDGSSGGLPVSMAEEGALICDTLSTAQVGLSALVVGDHDTAHSSARWVRSIADQSPSASPIFYSFRHGDALWTEPAPDFAWAAAADFSVPRQAYYTPGMGAVFLARYAARYGCEESLAAARRLAAFNIEGHEAQFSDLASVQACKFGWAVAELSLSDRERDWLPWVRRMTRWFLDRQTPEGSWGPSTFADPDPTVADRLVKTSEHLMELSTCMAALAASEPA